jgi:chemotaxis protein methyltransferase CheR
VRSQYRSMITFALLNLVETPYPFQHKFDVIFLRNVMIYFDKDTIQKVVDGMYEALAPGGYLFLGHSEAMSGVHRGLQRIGPSVYRKTATSLIQGIRKSA